jgi:hypothetical protein
VVRQNSGDVGGRLLTKWQSGRTEREREKERERERERKGGEREAKDTIYPLKACPQ